MGFKNTNDHLTGRVPAQTGDGYGVVAATFAIALTTDDLALNTVGAVGVLPARCVPVALYVEGTDMDTGTPALASSLGILNGDQDAISTTAADGGAVWAAGVKAGQAAGVEQVLSVPMLNVAASDKDRIIGMKITTAPDAAAAGTIKLHLLYRAV